MFENYDRPTAENEGNIFLRKHEYVITYKKKNTINHC